MKNQLVQNTLHWLLVTTGFLASLGSFAGYAHWIPGNIGRVLVALFVLIAGVERLLILVEQVLEGKKEADDVAGQAVREGEEIADDVKKLATTAEPFIKNSPKP